MGSVSGRQRRWIVRVSQTARELRGVNHNPRLSHLFDSGRSQSKRGCRCWAYPPDSFSLPSAALRRTFPRKISCEIGDGVRRHTREGPKGLSSSRRAKTANPYYRSLPSKECVFISVEAWLRSRLLRLGDFRARAERKQNEDCAQVCEKQVGQLAVHAFGNWI